MHDEPVSGSRPSDAPSVQTSFERCLVDGDRTAESGGRRRRRKTLGVSLAIETLLLMLVILAPLTGSVPQLHIPRTVYVPIASGGSHSPRPNAKADAAAHHPSNNHGLTFSLGGKPTRPEPHVDDGPTEAPGLGPDVMPGAAASDGPAFVDAGPVSPVTSRPEEIKKNSDQRPVKLSEGVVQAQLIFRVEPRYPPLAMQIHVQGTVQLHAIISREGRITLLEVASGHPLLVPAALDAVQQWRYRPTLLNGEPVEVETTISVIFQLQR